MRLLAVAVLLLLVAGCSTPSAPTSATDQAARAATDSSSSAAPQHRESRHAPRPANETLNLTVSYHATFQAVTCPETPALDITWNGAVADFEFAKRVNITLAWTPTDPIHDELHFTLSDEGGNGPGQYPQVLGTIQGKSPLVWTFDGSAAKDIAQKDILRLDGPACPQPNGAVPMAHQDVAVTVVVVR